MDNVDLLNGDLKRTFFKYLLPSVGGMLGVSLYVLGDTMIVGRGLGSVGLAALNISIPIINVFHGLGLLFGMGASTAISISRGRGEQEEVDHFFTQAIFFSLLVGFILLLVRILFLDELSYLLGASRETFALSQSYLGVLMTFSPFFLLNYTLNVLVRNDGNPRLSMYAMLAGSLINVLLDYVFVMIFGWGMAGLGLATSMSPVLGLFILSSHFIKKENHMHFTRLEFSLERFKRIVSNGVASFLIELSAGLVIFAFNLVILEITGDLGVSSYSIIANLSLIVAAIFTGVGQAIQPIVSINYGARRMERVYEVGRLALITSLFIGVVFYLTGLFFPEFLISIFTKAEPELIKMTVSGIRIYFLSFILMGINITLTSYLQSKEFGRSSMILSLLRGFIWIFVLLLILPKQFGLTGVWLTMPLSELLTLILSFFLFLNIRDLLAHTFCPNH